MKLFRKKRKFERKYIGWIFRNYNEKPKILDIIKLDRKKNTLILEDFEAEIYIDYSNLAFENEDGNYVYFIDINHGQMLVNGTEEDILSMFQEFKRMATNRTINDLINASKKQLGLKELWLYLLGFTGLGTFIGFFLAFLGFSYGWWG